MRRRSAEICVYVPTTVALYILNQKRDSLVQLETRYNLRVLVARDDALIPPAFRLERLRAYGPVDAAASPPPPLTQAPDIEEDGIEEEIDQGAEIAKSDRWEKEGEEESTRSRRRRRRRKRRDEEPDSVVTVRSEVVEEAVEASGEPTPREARRDSTGNGDEENEAEGRRRRRGRRGGRRRGRRESNFEPIFEEPRPPSDIVQILPAVVVEELRPAPMASLVNAAGEISAAEIETAGESGLPASDQVAAPGEMSREIADLATPHHAVEAPAAAEAAGSAERKASFTGKPERTPEAALSATDLPAEPERAVETASQRPSTTRRGWWQWVRPVKSEQER